jgi:hypothetical protein
VIDPRIAISYASKRMITAFLLMLFFALLPGTPPAYAAPAPATPAALEPASSPESILRVVSSFSPRQEGSPAEGALLDWIGARLAAHGIHAVPFDFSRSDFEHSFSRCLRVDVPGRSRDSLVLAVPVDAPPGSGPGEDGSINVALALDLLDHLKGTTPPLSLVVLFLGAEYGDTDVYPMGSTLFLRDYQPVYRTAVLYLNLKSVPGRILVRGGGRGIVSPFWLMNRCVDSLQASLVPYRLQADEVQAFRLGATEERTLIEPWLRAGYPAVGLEGEYGVARTPGSPEMLPALSSFLRAFVDAGREGIPEEWDRHYLLVQAGELSLILEEKAYVGVFAGSFAAVLLFALIFLKRLKKYVRTLLRNFLAIVPMAALVFLFLAAGTWAARGILLLRGFPLLWRYAPLEFLGLKVCAALFLAAALYNPLRRLPVPRNGSFYSAAALFFLLVEIIVVAVFDITFTSYFLWAFVFVFLSTLARDRRAKVILALPAPFWGIRGIINVFLVPALPFCRIITLSPVLGNLLVAGACLPFILVLLRLGLIFPGKGLLRRGKRELLLAGALLAAGSILAVRLLTFSPFSTDTPQPIAATQTVVAGSNGSTSSTTLEIDSPAPVRGISLSTPTGSRPLGVGWKSPLPLAHVDSPLHVTVNAGQFLRQQTVTLGVDMPSRPRSFSLAIESANDFVLFDSSFPAVRTGPRSYRLLVGAFPPAPLSLQLSLPIEETFTMTITAEFDSPLIGVDVQAGPAARVTTRVRVVRTLDVKT